MESTPRRVSSTARPLNTTTKNSGSTPRATTTISTRTVTRRSLPSSALSMRVKTLIAALITALDDPSDEESWTVAVNLLERNSESSWTQSPQLSHYLSRASKALELYPHQSAINALSKAFPSLPSLPTPLSGKGLVSSMPPDSPKTMDFGRGAGMPMKSGKSSRERGSAGLVSSQPGPELFKFTTSDLYSFDVPNMPPSTALAHAISPRFHAINAPPPTSTPRPPSAPMASAARAMTSTHPKAQSSLRPSSAAARSILTHSALEDSSASTQVENHPADLPTVRQALASAAAASSLPTSSTRSKTIATAHALTSQTQSGSTSSGPVVYDENLLQGRTGEDAVAFFASAGPADSVKFVYLNHAQSGSYRPFDLIVVPREDTNRDHFTMSAAGLVHIRPGYPTDYIGLSEWMRHSTLFNLLRSIKFFKYYLIGKAFHFWRRHVRYTRYCETRKKLQASLFLTKPVFQDTLLTLNKALVNIQDISLLSVNAMHTYTREEFLEVQASRRKDAAKVIDAITDRMQTLLKKTCEDVIDRTQVPDELTALLEDELGLSPALAAASAADSSSLLTALDMPKRRTKSMVGEKREKEKRDRELRLACAEAEMLGSFIRLIDYIAVENLAAVAVTNVESLLAATQSSWKYGLFQSVVSIGPKEMEFSPTKDEFLATVSSTIEETINTVHGTCRPLHLRALKPYVAPEGIPAPKGPSVISIIKDTPLFKDAAASLNSLVISDFEKVVTYSTFLQEFREIQEFGSSWSLESFKESNPSVDVFREKLDRMKHWVADVDRIKSGSSVGLFWVDSKKLKVSLLPIPSRVLNEIKAHLHTVARTSCQQVLSEFHTHTKVLQEKPTKLKEFTEHLSTVNSMEKEEKVLTDAAADVTAKFALLRSFDVKISSMDEVSLDDLATAAVSFQEALEQATLYTDSKLPVMSKTLLDYIAALDEQLGTQMTELYGGTYLDAKADPGTVLSLLAASKENIDIISDRAATYAKWQTIFGLESHQFTAMDETMSLYSSRLATWTAMSDWEALNKSWRSVAFTTLNMEEVQKETLLFSRRISKLQRKRGSDAVLTHLMESVNTFKVELPMLMDLGNPALKQRHWAQIFEALKLPFAPTTPFSIVDMKRADLHSSKDFIADVSCSATGENSLENALATISDAWDNYELRTIPHRDSKDVFILGGIDELTQQLEDHQVSLATMSGSRFVSGIKDQVAHWEATLAALADILEEWLSCQRLWLYLEVVFTQSDIKRQLPAESALFERVDLTWRDFMRKVHYMPSVLEVLAIPDVLDTFQSCNATLEQIKKALEDYLETKRRSFPRFYFLSNDELLQIIARSRDASAVQPHLRKVFDNIAELEFSDDAKSAGVISAMISAEGEQVPFRGPVFAKGNVEHWLADVEHVMQVTLYDVMKEALMSYAPASAAGGPSASSDLERWLFAFPAQVVLTITQVIWTNEISLALDAARSSGSLSKLHAYQASFSRHIDTLVSLATSQLDQLQRTVVGALITLAVHGRDVLQELINSKISTPTDFSWTKQLRYYWDAELDNLVIAQGSASFLYGYEYLGNTSRLVITPLTDQCYLTLTNALQMHLGGAPTGPAGTGKTETVKDLAKALARWCVTQNCSSGLDHKMMTRMFSGLAQAGVWACFDEFNRIPVEVLSVTAQLVLTIQQGLAASQDTLLFDGGEIPLHPNYGAFVTMNPGYAGRTELPDNLKVLFRPVSMMIPDYALIAEIVLYSQGFTQANTLARKMVNLYRLCAEQLSQQDHYDFGMRALKSVLDLAGVLKRKLGDDISEEELAIRALRDTNMPKFLARDVPLFLAIVRDLMPDIALSESQHPELHEAIVDTLVADGLQPVPSFVDKVIQLHETTYFRHGVMLIGRSGTGKSTMIRTLADAITNLRAATQPDAMPNSSINVTTINPKAVGVGGLYGQFNEVSNEWKDGLIASTIRNLSTSQTSSRKWIVFDGPVDAAWIEDMNTVLDDNKMLCLANGERIKIPNTMSLIFEVQDLAAASPATVSRCGMVYLEPEHLGWEPPLRSWAQVDLVGRLGVSPGDASSIVDTLASSSIPAILEFLRGSPVEVVQTEDIMAVEGFTRLASATIARMVSLQRGSHPMPQSKSSKRGRPGGLDGSSSLVGELLLAQSLGALPPSASMPAFDPKAVNMNDDENDDDDESGNDSDDRLEGQQSSPTGSESSSASSLNSPSDAPAQIPTVLANAAVAWALVWSFGGNLKIEHRLEFSRLVRPLMMEVVGAVPFFPLDAASSTSVFDFVVCPASGRLRPWYSIMPQWSFDPSISYWDIFVPTTSTVQYRFLLDLLVRDGASVFLTGPSGAGKTTLVHSLLEDMANGVEPFARSNLECAPDHDGQMDLPPDSATSLGSTLDSAESKKSLPLGPSTSSVSIAQSTAKLQKPTTQFGWKQIDCSAHTSVDKLQAQLEAALTKRRRNELGPAHGSTMLLFLDNLNLPTPDEYGSNPPAELVRQILDQGGLYDNDKLFWKAISDTQFITAGGSPGGARHPLPPRLMRHMNVLALPQETDENIMTIFTPILQGGLEQLKAQPELIEMAPSLISASIEVFSWVASTMLPTPSRSHYSFNLRDLSSLIYGLLQASEAALAQKEGLVRLWVHETCRVFRDRLVDSTDRSLFDNMLVEATKNAFGVERSPESLTSVVFAALNSSGYREWENKDELAEALMATVSDYNSSTSLDKAMDLVMFPKAAEMVTRIARILAQPRGNAVLAGVGGSGRRSLTRLAAHLCESHLMELNVTAGYGLEDFREELKTAIGRVATTVQSVTLLISDSDITCQGMLDDINSLLNSGTVPGLLSREEREKLLGEYHARQILPSDEAPSNDGEQSHDASGRRQSTITESPTGPSVANSGDPSQAAGEDAWMAFVGKIREQLHIVLALSPVGDSFRTSVRQFPSLVTCCSVLWFDGWDVEAFKAVAQSRLAGSDCCDPEQLDAVVNVLAHMHESSAAAAKVYDAQYNRKVYTTPTSFLSLLELFSKTLTQARDDLTSKSARYSSGLAKLKDTAERVAEMQEELNAMQPEMEKAQEESETLMAKIEEDQTAADQAKAKVAEEEKEVEGIAAATKTIYLDAQADLEEAMPQYQAAVKAVKSLKREHITEVRHFNNPPELVIQVMNAVCLLNGYPQTWEAAKRFLNEPGFLRILENFDKDNIAPPILSKLKKYINDPQFMPSIVEKISVAAKSLCMWVRAIHTYARVYKSVLPKKEALAKAEARLEDANSQLKEKQANLAKIDAEVKKLRTAYDECRARQEDITIKIDAIKVKKERAEKLTSGLADERGRWEIELQEMEERKPNVVGNALMVAGAASYHGPFPGSIRDSLSASWADKMAEEKLSVSENVNTAQELSTDMERRSWAQHGLPSDKLSMDNAAIMLNVSCAPLMIDPQGQGYAWIKSLYRDHGLVIAGIQHPRLLRVLEAAVRTGTPVLIEGVEETLDSVLEPLLTKRTTSVGGRPHILIGEKSVELHPNFKLFLRTKLPNPHFLPEVSTMITLVNFAVTKDGLREQLLTEVVSLERPDLETQRDGLVLEISNNTNQLKDIEDSILKLLATSTGNILDDEKLIDTLAASKRTAAEVYMRTTQARETAYAIDQTRNLYGRVAARGAMLYFVVSALAEVDPMYMFSLSAFKQVFVSTLSRLSNSIEETLDDEASEVDLAPRIQMLSAAITSAVYDAVCRGLFNRDRLLFSVMIALEMNKDSGDVTPAEWSALVRGLDDSSAVTSPVSWLDDRAWAGVLGLNTIPGLGGIVQGMTVGEDAGEMWKAYLNAASPLDVTPPPPFDSLSPFQHLIICRTLRPEKVVSVMRSLVVETLGSEFIKSPPLDLAAAFADSTNKTPIMFVLSGGADPTAALLDFARSMNRADRMQMVSLGQGQGPLARRVIEIARAKGDWVVLQNCHLAGSWLGELEVLLEDGIEGEELSPDFRLWLTAAPTREIPVGILQDSLKLSMEPPRGLKACMEEAYMNLSDEVFGDESGRMSKVWKKTLFALTMFHAVLLERRRYGALGFNEQYSWNKSDWMVSLQNLRMVLDDAEDEEVPWEALQTMVGQIHYGGRVTDYWDARAVGSILKRFLTEDMLVDGFKFTNNGLHRSPHEGDLDYYRAIVAALPLEDGPESLGLHANAQLSLQRQEAKSLLDGIVAMAPRDFPARPATADAKAVSEEADVLSMATELLDGIPEPMQLRRAHESVFMLGADGIPNGLGVFLEQEVQRYNELLDILRGSLESLGRALRGQALMNAKLDKLHRAVSLNVVPEAWSAVSYPSTLALRPWLADLGARVGFIRSWLEKGAPKHFWLGGFFFLQGFLTAVLQTHARATSLPVDTLKLVPTILKPSVLKSSSSTSLAGLKRKASRKSVKVRRVSVSPKPPADESPDSPASDANTSGNVAAGDRHVEEKVIGSGGEGGDEGMEEGDSEPGMARELSSVFSSGGVLVTGLYMEGAVWDSESGLISEAVDGQLYCEMPVMRLSCVDASQERLGRIYRTPVYRTPARRGTLSTTGHSTSFITALDLPSNRSSEHWTRRSVALVCERPQ